MQLAEQFDALTPDVLRRRGGVKWTRYAPDVLPAWVADMDFPIAEPIRDRLRAVIGESDVGYAYPPKFGGLGELFVERMQQRFGWTVDFDRLELLINVLQGIDAGIVTRSKEGEGVVLLTPIYPPFLAAVAGCRRRFDECRLVASGDRYELDLDRLEAAIQADTRVLLLCNPHNPTGRVFSRAELEAVGEIAARHDLTVVSDEIHQDLVYPESQHVVFASIDPELEKRTITLTSATKAFSLAGLECAFAVFGSEELHRGFEKLPRRLLGHPAAMGAYAVDTAWREGDDWLRAVLNYLDGNRHFLRDWLSEHLPEIDYKVPEATFLTWLDCRALELGMPASRFFLKQAKVAFNPGEEFGPPGAGHARLNIATSRRILVAVLERMKAAIEARG